MTAAFRCMGFTVVMWQHSIGTAKLQFEVAYVARPFFLWPGNKASTQENSTPKYTTNQG